ncbi:hypothetical protein MMC17_004221 [Xylographa soralifera]|nr:hypothetical protein [Xylographa soralifera]
MSTPLQDTPHPQTLGDIHHSTASMHESSAYQPEDTKIEEGQGLPPTAPADTPLSLSSSPSPNTAPDVPPNASPFRRLTGWRLVVVEACLCLGLLLSIVDSSIVATALVNIEDYFNDFFDQSIWVVLAYLLAYMAFSLLWARLSDVLGRKWMVVAAWSLFTAFSLGCGLATSLQQLIVFRALQGIGGSGLYSLCNVVIPEITPSKHFATMSAATGVVFAISSVLGPVLGGVISQQSTWRWIFLLNVPCGVVALVTILLTWPSPPLPPGLTKHTLGAALLGHVDFVGALLLVVSSVLLIVALEEAGAAKESWSAPVIISTLSISGVCFLCLIVWILVLNAGKIPITPILPVRLLTHRIMAAAILSTLFTGFPLFLTIIALPERYQIVNGDGATSAGVRMMPLLFASAFGSTVGGLCSSRKNRTFVTLLVASCLMVVGCALLSTASDGLEIEPALYGFQVIFGLGLGTTFTTVTIIASSEAKFADYSIALGAVNQARIFGGTVGLAASTIILNKRLVNELQGVLSEIQLVELRQSLNYIPSLEPAQQLAVAQTFARSFNDQLRDCTYVAAACVVISLFTYSRHPTDIMKRKARGEALLAGRITLAEADA